MVRNFLFILTILIVNSSEINSLSENDNVLCNKYYNYVDNADLNLDVMGCEVVTVEMAEGTNPTNLDKWQLLIKTQASNDILVNLKRNDDLLADENTPIWFGQNTYTGFGDINYKKTNIKMVATEFDKFTTFQGYNEKAAMVVFSNESSWIVEGFLGNRFLKHESGELYSLLEVTFYADSIISDFEHGRNCDDIVENLSLTLNSSLKIIYPEVLVALDWDSVQNKTPTEVIRSVLIYYNAVDMLFSQFQSPKIRLSIAGVIIPTDSRSSPYFEKCGQKFDDSHISYARIHGYLTRHFQKYRDIFSTKNYDIIMGMSSVQFCDADHNCNYYSVSHQSGDCESVNGKYFTPITGAVRHPNFQGHYTLIAKEIAHILGGDYVPYWRSACCSGIMSEDLDPLQWTINWSPCAIDSISKYFRKNNEYLSCMLNEPKRLKTVSVTPETTTTTTTTTTQKITPIPETTTEAVITDTITTAAEEPNLTTRSPPMVLVLKRKVTDENNPGQKSPKVFKLFDKWVNNVYRFICENVKGIDIEI